MARVYVKHEELWEPWYIGPDLEHLRDYPTSSADEVDLPDELIRRFHAAKAEIEDIWEQVNRLHVRALRDEEEKRDALRG